MYKENQFRNLTPSIQFYSAPQVVNLLTPYLGDLEVDIIAFITTLKTVLELCLELDGKEGINSIRVIFPAEHPSQVILLIERRRVIVQITIDQDAPKSYIHRNKKAKSLVPFKLENSSKGGRKTTIHPKELERGLRKTNPEYLSDFDVAKVMIAFGKAFELSGANYFEIKYPQNCDPSNFIAYMDSPHLADMLRMDESMSAHKEDGKRIYRRASELPHPELPSNHESNLTKKQLKLRVPPGLIEKIDRVVASTDMCRNDWLVAAIEEKLMRSPLRNRD